MNKRPSFFWIVILLLLLLFAFWSDDPVRSFVKQRADSQGQQVMIRVTRLGDGIWLLVLIAGIWLSGYFFKSQRWMQAARFSCYGFLSASLAVHLLKHFVGRPRPQTFDQGMVHLQPFLIKGYGSFPSGHAVTSFAVAAVLARFYPRGKWLFYGIAGLIGISRIYLDLHFASDVIAGAVLGTLIGLGLFQIEPAIQSTEIKIVPAVRKMFSQASLWVCLGLTLLSGVLFFYQLGSFTLTDVDEAVYAASTLEMIKTGDFVTPRYNGINRYDKPILLYWLIATAYSLFGVNEFAARFWSALLGVGLVLMTFLFAEKYGGIKLGLVSALILATSLETVALAHAAVTDMALVFFMTAALYAFFSAFEGQDPVRRHSLYLAAGAATALAVLIKGPVAVVIPILIVALFLIATKEWRSILTAKSIIGVGAVFFLIAAPWYLMQLFINGWEFVDSFILKHNVGRYTGVISGHSGPWFYYFIVLAAGFFPWVSFLPAAIFAQVSKRLAFQSARLPAGQDDRLWFFLLIWFAAVFLFFSFAQTKLPNYVAPLFPPASILVAQWLVRNFSDQWDLDRSAWVSIGIFVLMTMGLAIMFMAVPSLIEKTQQKFNSVPYLTGTIDIGQGPRLLALELLIGAMLGLWMMIRRPFASVFFLAGMMTLFHLTVIHQVLPVVDRYAQRPLKDMALLAGRELKDGRLIVYGMNKPSVLFYANRHAWNVFHPDTASDLRLQALLDSSERHFVITRVNLLPRLKTMSHFFIVDRQGGYLLASNRPAN